VSATADRDPGPDAQPADAHEDAYVPRNADHITINLDPASDTGAARFAVWAGDREHTYRGHGECRVFTAANGAVIWFHSFRPERRQPGSGRLSPAGDLRATPSVAGEPHGPADGDDPLGPTAGVPGAAGERGAVPDADADAGPLRPHWHSRYVARPVGPHAHEDATYGHLHTGSGAAIYRAPGTPEPELTFDPDDYPLL